MTFNLKPIGYLKSVFHYKNGTPRQSSLCESARGILTIEKSIFTNPEHSLEGLEEYSHAWILFVFHKNNNPHFKAKVKPPRLNGRRVGVFASRSPYRPNNVGLSLVKLDKIEGSSVHLSGIDILDGTPVLDIKPYIPAYDAPSQGFPLPSHDKPGNCEDKQLLSDSSIENRCTQSGLATPALKTDFTHESDETTNVTDASILDNEEKKFKLPGKNIPKKKVSELFQVNGNEQYINSDMRNEHENENNNSCNTTPLDVGQVTEGFYSMSAALYRAEERLRQPSTSSSEIVNTQSVQELKSAFSHSKKYHEASVKVVRSEQDVSDLVGNIISQAALEFEKMCQGIPNLETEQSLITLPVSESFQEDPTSLHHVSLTSIVESQKESSNTQEDESLLKIIQNSEAANLILDQMTLELEKDLKGDNASCVSSQTLPYTHTHSHLLNPDLSKSKTSSTSSQDGDSNGAVVAPWLSAPATHPLNVSFTMEALSQLSHFSQDSQDQDFRLQMITHMEEAQQAISSILREDPRSVYRKRQCIDTLYFFAVDILHVTCWFDSESSAKVIRVQPAAWVTKLKTDNAEAKQSLSKNNKII